MIIKKKKKEKQEKEEEKKKKKQKKMQKKQNQRKTDEKKNIRIKGNFDCISSAGRYGKGMGEGTRSGGTATADSQQPVHFVSMFVSAVAPPRMPARQRLAVPVF